MPFTRSRNTSGRRVRISVPTLRRPASNLSYRQKRAVREMIRKSGEPNHFDVLISAGTDITTSGTFHDITEIPQGDGDSQRVGDRLLPTSAMMKLYLTHSGASAGTNGHSIVRVSLVRWKPDTANIDLTALSQLFETDYFGLPLADATERKKFNILYDKHFSLSSVNGDTGFSSTILEKTVSLKGGANVIYNEGLTTGANKLYVIISSSSGVANDVECFGNLRLNYRN